MSEVLVPSLSAPSESSTALSPAETPTIQEAKEKSVAIHRELQALIAQGH
ncbi:hypothetical protein HMPREF0291_11601 [Corynebacterium genitalium ATCC 33030]|uniref:Uncharacterized protein n=1 Tax=Corynebacterium genitalium ATCC 33030 TaxID=585529 RepID=D7WCR3_9CORY|nr:hypothetical protein HMPREF0291_11601 [Corynebacterium genitalium ATCC 33030]